MLSNNTGCTEYGNQKQEEMRAKKFDPLYYNY